ncbi:hypothetical protein [Haladaptatus sp. DJG-WS-42]|uniref:hypothetical protein n=1 Tax=Haladaptatus sp. DJG-WS-42 TaxID=3120516 RepID=UPI0030CCFB28
MTELVFPLYNVHMPEAEYTNDQYEIRIELLEGAEEFENQRRENGSEYAHGYWHTANAYIDQPIEEAKNIIDVLSQILSFALNRDVRFNGYYEGDDPDAPFLTMSICKFDIDNTNLKLIHGVPGGQSNPGVRIGPFLDTALDTVLSANEGAKKQKMRTISQFLEATAVNFASTKFIILWMALESSANQNYTEYREAMGDLFTDDEIEWVIGTVLRSLESGLSDKQLDVLEYRFNKRYLYEHSAAVKIKIYLEYLDIGFDMDEIEEIIQHSREIRNVVVHESDGSPIIDNTERLVELRKIVIFVILRKLGIGKEFQERLITPQIMGPDIS